MELLTRFKKEEEEMAKGLRQLLANGEEKVRIKDFKQMLSKIRAGKRKESLR